MPIDPVTGSLIVAGASAIGQGANAYAQGKTNKKTREYNREMYEKQKADNIAQWHMQNEYNHPSAQMARLREAGLNPNLVYGNGADATAQSIQNATPASWNPKAPEVDLGRMAEGGLSAYYDVQLKQAQVDNVRANTTVAAQDAILKGQMTANAEMEWNEKNFNLGQKAAVNDYFIEATKENLRKLKIETDYLGQEKAANLNQLMANIAKTQSDTKHSQASIQAILKDNQLRDLDIWLKKNGINPNDPAILRILGQGVREIIRGKSIADFIQNFKNNIK